jgi:hypothetical protein
MISPILTMISDQMKSKNRKAMAIAEVIEAIYETCSGRGQGKGITCQVRKRVNAIIQDDIVGWAQVVKS